MACDLGDGGRDAVRADLKDSVGKVGRHKGDPTGSHDKQPLILLGRDFVRGGVKVSRVYGGYRGDVGVKIPAAGPTEGFILSKLQVS